MRLRAVLVDLDGTLVESDDANASAYAEALGEFGVLVEAADVAPRIRGRSWRDFLPELIGAGSGVDPAAVARRKQALYPGHFGLLRLNQGLVDLVASLRGRFAVALVTTASRRSAEPLLAHFALNGVFDTLVFGDDVTRLKPDPEAYHLAASRMQVAPGECIVIEDSDVGVAAARAFGGGLLRWSG